MIILFDLKYCAEQVTELSYPYVSPSHRFGSVQYFMPCIQESYLRWCLAYISDRDHIYKIGNATDGYQDQC